MPKNPSRYSTGLIIIHWLTAVLILGAWLTAKGGRKVIENPPLLHFALGLAVLVLVLPRLVLRLTGGAPAPVQHRGWLALAAKAGHGLLYLFLIALPISGWYAASRMSVSVGFFGWQLPALTAAVQGRPGLIADLHENAGTIILFLAGVHAVMALWHQFILHDGTLRRMSLR